MKQNAIIVGSGNSLRGFDFNLINDKTIFAVNYTYEYCLADHLVFWDKGFLNRERSNIESFKGEVHTISPVGYGYFAYHEISEYLTDE